MITSPCFAKYSLLVEVLFHGHQKLTCFSHSTMESEFIVFAVAEKDVEWLRNMLLDIEL